MTLDIGDTLAPKSEQLDAVDLLAGERIFTIKEVRIGAGEQPASIYFEEFDRPWRPGVNQRRVLSGVWGDKGSVYVGRRVALYCDTTVQYGGKAVGGIRIRAMSHIDKPQKVLILASQGRPDFYPVEPLGDDAPAATPADPTAAKIAALQQEWHTATPERKADIVAEVAVLRNEPTDQP